MKSEHILAGDVGGTKTLLALARREQGGLVIEREKRFDTASYASLVPMAHDFLAGEKASSACFGIAAPITGRKLRLTNRDFLIDADALQSQCRIDRVDLINDFAAIGHGLEVLREEEFAVLQQGHAQVDATRVLIGAGTGLGQAILAWQGEHYAVLSTEGGHTDFAPQDEEQIALWRALSAQYGHVSYERILSGPGLVDLFRFCAGAQGRRVEELDAAAISASALAGNDEAALGALRLFVRIYGQQAGNLALTALARGGVYVAGGIAPQILAFMQQGEFMAAFRAKGRYQGLLGEIPVKVVLNPKVGLLGAAVYASRRLPT